MKLVAILFGINAAIVALSWAAQWNRRRSKWSTAIIRLEYFEVEPVGATMARNARLLREMVD